MQEGMEAFSKTEMMMVLSLSKLGFTRKLDQEGRGVV